MLNSHISHYPFAGISLQHKASRDRKLLLHKKQINKWHLEVEKKRLAIVPTKIFFSKRLAKVEIALVRGKKKYDRRQTIRKREAEFEMRRSLKKPRF